MAEIQITVHACDICGSHATETYDADRQVHAIAGAVKGVEIVQCPDCKQWVCRACFDERWCCEHQEDERELATGVPAAERRAGQRGLFEDNDDEPSHA